MTDLYHYFGEDLQLDEEGALRSVDGALATRQNILRRLCTNPKAYLWHSEYGAGLPARVGTPIREVETQGLITAQLALEASIDHDQPVIVTLTPLAVSTYRCSITYTEQGEESGQIFTFNQSGTI
ncbi:phage tail protein [Asaia sp. BMEF1]|uniref:phage tail protein n=1 Tax=Asaia sp. BMEF1 TaxID=3155932 RepID=UPI003F668797